MEEQPPEVSELPEWVLKQASTFTNWVNTKIGVRDLKIKSVLTDFDGIVFITLLEVVFKTKCPFKYNANVENVFQKRENFALALDFCKLLQIKLVGMSAQGLLGNNDPRHPLGIVWTIICHSLISNAGTDEEILDWAKEQVEGKGIVIEDINESFRSGEAYLAILHNVHPENTELEQQPSDQESNFSKAKEVLLNDGVKLFANSNSARSILAHQTRRLYRRYSEVGLQQEHGKSGLLRWARAKTKNRDLTNFTSDWASGETFLRLYDGIYGVNEGKEAFVDGEIQQNFEKAKELFQSKGLNFILDPENAVGGFDEQSIMLQVADLFNSAPSHPPKDDEVPVSREVEMEMELKNEGIEESLLVIGLNENVSNLDEEKKEDVEVPVKNEAENVSKLDEVKNEPVVKSEEKPNNCILCLFILLLLLLLFLYSSRNNLRI